MRTLFFVASLSLVARTISGQVIIGSVRDLSSGDPVYAAKISVFGRETMPVKVSQTDSLGAYRIIVATGAYHIRITRIGYAPFETTNFVVGDDSTISRDVFLQAEPARLASVDITSKPVVTSTLANPHKFDLFLERRARGFGFFLTHDEIKSKNIYRLQQLLQSVPGIKVRQDRQTWKLQSQHCSGKTIPGMVPYPDRDPLIFLDGHLTKGIEQLDHIDPSQIEGLEVYQGGAELPAEALGEACFAIFIWFRTIGQ